MPTLASLVELASTRGFKTNMRATRSTRGFLRVLLLSSFVSLLWAAVMADRKLSTSRPASKRGRYTHQQQQQQRQQQHHRPLTDEQEADQNLQFMLSLYRSAAEPDGRPRQYRKFGSNTVRLLRPSASSVRYLPASPGGFTFQSKS